MPSSSLSPFLRGSSGVIHSAPEVLACIEHLKAIAADCQLPANRKVTAG